MYSDTNPFTFGALALDEAFTDREDELKELAVDIRNGQDVLVFAPRRYGKSSLVLRAARSEEHTSELQSLTGISYAVFCLRSEERRVGKEC